MAQEVMVAQRAQSVLGAKGCTRLSRRAAVAAAALLPSAAMLPPQVRAQLFGPRTSFRARDWLLLARVDNRSGDTALDGWVLPALEVALAQSKHVNVVPARRLTRLVRQAQIAPGSPLDDARALALAAAQRFGAVLVVEIDPAPAGLALAARLLDARSRALVLRSTAAAPSSSRVFEALDELLHRVRVALGESAESLRAARLPLAEASSASLHALARWAESLRHADGGSAAAEALLVQAIELDAGFAQAMAALAYRRAQHSDRESRLDSQRLYQRALALPQRQTARERLWTQAMADDWHGQRDEAVVGYKALLAQYPDDGRTWFRLGWTYMAALNRIEDAVAAFRRVTELDPSDAGAWVNLATCYGPGLDRYADAVATYHKAFALEPETQFAQHVNGEYGAALVHLGRLDEARENFELMRRQPGAVRQARAHRSLAFLAMHQGRYRVALAELDQALALNRSLPNLMLSVFRDLVIKAGAHLALGSRREAEDDLAAAGVVMAQRWLAPEWLIRLVRLRARLGDAEECRRLIEAMAAAVGAGDRDSGVSRNLGDDQGYLDLARGELALLQGQPAAALAHAAAAALRLRQRRVIGLQGRAHEAAGALEQAAARHRELADLAPFGYEEQEDGVQARFALAALLERLGRADEARAQYTRLLAPWNDGDAQLVLRVRARARLRALAR